MRSLALFFFLALVVPERSAQGLMVRTLHAMTRLLNYFLVNIDEINLDAVFCARRVQEQLEAYLANQPEVFLSMRRWVEVLSYKAKRVADEGTTLIYSQTPKYADVVGMMLNKSTKLVWYPSADTSEEYIVPAKECRHSYFNYGVEDDCYGQLSGRGGKKCVVDPSCNAFNNRTREVDYGITHQVLYWQAMEGFECVGRFPLSSRRRWCSNVMRDAVKIFSRGMPESHADLFMEQVGLCGQWGFRDFNKEDWLEAILDWQAPSGCYNGRVFYRCFDDLPKQTLKRVKRREVKLNDGCLSHKTAVGLMALTVNMRFEAEKSYLRRNEKSDNRINQLLDGVPD